MQDPAVLDRAVLGAPTSQAEAEPEIAARQLSQLQLISIRFRRHKPAMIGSVVILLLIAVAVFAPLLTPESPYNQFSYDILNRDLSPRFADANNSPAWWFMFGTDDGGHALVSQIAWGARISLEVGFISAFGASLIGILVGAVAGFFGGWVDTLMMRVTDVFLTLPFLPTLLVVADLLGQGQVSLIIVIFIFFSWPGVARLTRASYLSLREQEFTEAARAVGVSNSRIIFRHLLPNALRPVIVATTLSIASFIVVEAAIDFLNAGIQYPDVSWGSILSNAEPALLLGNWWWGLFPGVALTLTVLAVNFIGDGLGDALDVRSKL